MAYIHASHNDLEDKLRKAEHDQQVQRMSYHVNERKQFNKMRPLYLTLGVVCILVFVYLIWNHSLPRTVRLWFAEGLVDKTMERLRNPWIDEESGGILIILFLLLDVIWPIVCMVARILMPVLGWLVWILIYVLPLLIGSVLLATHWHKKQLDAPLPDLSDYTPLELALENYMAGIDGDLGIYQAGVEGERKALEYLHSLSNDCHIFTNLRVPHDGHESETDMVVVTPAGVTIVEIKNYKGTIMGDASDKNLSHIKPHQDEFIDEYNPIRQVATHAYRLAGYLRNHGVFTHVKTCVFFVNDDVTLKLTDSEHILADKCPVFQVRDVNRLLHYLQSGKAVFSDNNYSKTLDLMELLVR